MGRATRPGNFRPGEKINLKFSQETGPDPEFRVRVGFFAGRAEITGPEKLDNTEYL